MNNPGGIEFELTDVDFSDVEITVGLEFKTRYIKPPKTKDLEEHLLKYSNAEKLAKDILIEEKSRYFVVIDGSFYFGDFIEALIIDKGYHVEKMTISTLSLNENNVDSLAGLLKAGLVNELNLIVSDYFYSHERHNLTPYIFKELDINNKFQLASAGTHCKLCIIKTKCGKHIVIHGSANLRTSGNIEQIVIEENKTLFDFNDAYQDEIIKKFKTINKSVRGKDLWRAIN